MGVRFMSDAELHAVRIALELIRQDSERRIAAERRISRLPHLTHAIRTDGREGFISFGPSLSPGWSDIWLIEPGLAEQEADRSCVPRYSEVQPVDACAIAHEMLNETHLHT